MQKKIHRPTYLLGEINLMRNSAISMTGLLLLVRFAHLY